MSFRKRFCENSFFSEQLWRLFSKGYFCRETHKNSFTIKKESVVKVRTAVAYE